MSTWKLKTAAEALGVSHETIRQAIIRGELAGSQVAGPGGLSWRVEPEAARAWQAHRSDAAGLGEVPSEPAAAAEQTSEHPSAPGDFTAPEKPSTGAVPLAAHLRVLDVLEAAHAEAAREREAREETRKVAERESRRVEHLAAELQSYQRVLAEQAESLHEARARVMTLEMSVQEAHVIDHQAEELTETLPEQSPTPALGTGSIVSTSRNREGWGKRFRRWFLGGAQERTG